MACRPGGDAAFFVVELGVGSRKGRNSPRANRQSVLALLGKQLKRAFHAGHSFFARSVPHPRSTSLGNPALRAVASDSSSPVIQSIAPATAAFAYPRRADWKMDQIHGRPSVHTQRQPTSLFRWYPQLLLPLVLATASAPLWRDTAWTHASSVSDQRLLPTFWHGRDHLSRPWSAACPGAVMAGSLVTQKPGCAP
jgi:hypothetical protein